jgi:hypothetical protein
VNNYQLKGRKIKAVLVIIYYVIFVVPAPYCSENNILYEIITRYYVSSYKAYSISKERKTYICKYIPGPKIQKIEYDEKITF